MKDIIRDKNWLEATYVNFEECYRKIGGDYIILNSIDYNKNYKKEPVLCGLANYIGTDWGIEPERTLDLKIIEIDSKGNSKIKDIHFFDPIEKTTIFPHGLAAPNGNGATTYKYRWEVQAKSKKVSILFFPADTEWIYQTNYKKIIYRMTIMGRRIFFSFTHEKEFILFLEKLSKLYNNILEIIEKNPEKKVVLPEKKYELIITALIHHFSENGVFDVFLLKNIQYKKYYDERSIYLEKKYTGVLTLSDIF